MRQQTFRTIAAVAALLTIGMAGTAEAQLGWLDTAEAYAGRLGNAFGIEDEWRTDDWGRGSRNRSEWDAWCAGYGNQRDQRRPTYGFELPRYDDLGRQSGRNGRYGPQQRYRDNSWGSAPNRRNTRSWNDGRYGPQQRYRDNGWGSAPNRRNTGGWNNRANECREYERTMRSYDQRRYQQRRQARRPAYSSSARRTPTPRPTRSAVRRTSQPDNQRSRLQTADAPARRAVTRPEPAGTANTQAPETTAPETETRRRARWIGALPMGAGAAARPRNERR